MEPRARNLVAIERMQVSRQVLDEISAYIDQNQLRPGDKLPGDREFVSALKVSRPLVQQALKVLEGLGRVTIVHGLGTFVADNGHRVAAAELVRGVSESDLLPGKLLEVLGLIDRETLRLAYQHDRDALLVRLRSFLDERGRELTEDVDDESSLGVRFEGLFGDFCDNEILRRLQVTVHHAWLQAQLDGDWPLRDRFALHHDHEEIYELLASRDLDGAFVVLDRHIDGLRA